MATFRFDLNDEYSKKLEVAAVEKRMSIQEYIRYNLKCFFNGKVSRENIIDLAGTGDIKNGLPDDLNVLLRNYIDILIKRQKLERKQ